VTRVRENVLHYSAQTSNFPLSDTKFASEVTYQKVVSPATSTTHQSTPVYLPFFLEREWSFIADRNVLTTQLNNISF